MHIQTYVKKHLLDEQSNQLSKSDIEKHIRSDSQLNEDEKNDLIRQVYEGGLEEMSPGLRRWVLIGAFIVLVVVGWIVLRAFS